MEMIFLWENGINSNVLFFQPSTITMRKFNSGIMPATANSYFQYTFDRSGDIAYHCIIHPWRAALVSVSNAIERGNNFGLSSGTGPYLAFCFMTRTGHGE